MNRSTPQHRWPRAGLTTAPVLTLLALMGASVWASPSGLASVLPAEALVYSEISEPGRTLDLATSLAFWPELISLLADLDAMCDLKDDDLRGLWRLVSDWEADPLLRHEVKTLTGDRLALVLLPGSHTETPGWIFVARGTGHGLPQEALARLVSRVESVGTELVDDAGGLVRITDPEGETLMVAQQSAGWLVFSRPATRSSVAAIAAALAETAPRPSLADSESFRWAAQRLPLAAEFRALVSTQGLAHRLELLEAECGPIGRLATALLGPLESLGFARRLGPEGIRVWITGQVSPGDGRRGDLLATVAPIERPLSELVPAEVLAVWDLGVPAATALAAIDPLLARIAPALSDWISTGIQQLRSADRLDPGGHLMPHLGDGLAIAVLPADSTPGVWPLPRPLLLTRVEDEEAVRSFFTDFFRWEAGAVAGFSQGLLSAMVVREEHEGVELLGLQVDGLLPLPTPSPRIGVVDGLLVISPVSSAVKEVISAIHGNRDRHSAWPIDAVVPAAAVELVHLNLRAWEREWYRFEQRQDVDSELEDLLICGEGRASARRLMRALFRFLGALGEAYGVTTSDGAGGFDFGMEFRMQP